MLKIKLNRKHLLILAVLLLFTGGIVFGSYLKRVSDYQQKVQNLSAEDFDLSSLKDGTYIGEYNADFIYAKVEVTVFGGSITKVSLLEHRNERGKSAEAIIDKVMKQQTLKVDAVAGATNSSKVILAAIEDALKKGRD